MALHTSAVLANHFTMNQSDQQMDGTVRPGVVWAIIAVCVAVEITLLLADYGFWASVRLRSQSYENAGFWIGLLDNWQSNYRAQPYSMFLSYGFLHSGPLHLVVNMVTLFSLGRFILPRIGQARFAVLYGLSMIGGAIGFAVLSDSYRPMVGASGALFGLVGAIAAWEYVDRFTAQLRLWPVLRLLAILAVLNVVMWWAMDGQLAWQTHLGGFVSGWILAFLIDPRPRPVEFD